MAKPIYLLDIDVLAELTRPNGNRRVFTWFQQRQNLSALAAPVVNILLGGIESLEDGARKQQLRGFAGELLNSGMPVLPFDRDAAIWLSRQAARQSRLSRAWTTFEGQLAAIAAVHELVLVARSPSAYAATPGLKLDDWFRP